MKIPLTYGLGIAIGGAVITLILYLLGFQSDPDKLMLGMIIGFVAGLAVTITMMLLGLRAARAEAGAAGFSYGQALKTGVLISLFAALGAALFYYVYFGFINRDYTETVVQWTTNMMERANAPADRIADAEAKIRADSNPTTQARNGFIFSLITGTVIALIMGAFMRRPRVEAPPPIAA